MASAAVTSKKTKSPTANKNYSANLAKGGSVTVKDGVKTYSDKSLQVKGKGGISISGKDYSVNKGGSGFAPTTSVITADKMKPVPPIPLASPAPIDGMFGITNAANAGLAALNGGTYDTKTNQIVPPPAAPAAPADNNQAILNSYLQANAGLEAPSAVNNLKEMQKTLRPKENLVNSLSGQLNTLNASRDAEMLKLEGQGRGQTSGFIGGEQARINREAAIQAMPIQAQLAIAQDDLDSARTYASQYFQAKMQDETNIYNQKKENNRLIFDYLTSAEQRRLDANEKALDREYNEKQATAKSAEAIALQAIEYGQSSLASKVMGLDPKSATYAQDVRNAMAGLKKPVAATSAPKRDTAFDKDGNLVDMQTGEVVRYAEDVAPGDGGYTPAEIVQQKADSLASQIKDIETLKNHPGMKATVGAYGFARSTPLTVDKSEQKDFVAGVEQLISQKFLDSLIDTKAKGGSFGALTKPEQDALTVAATKIGAWRLRDGDGENAKVIGYEIGETEMQRELDTLITLAQKAESMARGYDVSLVPSNDSALIDDLYKTYITESSTPANYYK